MMNDMSSTRLNKLKPLTRFWGGGNNDISIDMFTLTGIDLRSSYRTELSLLAFADIPNEKLVAEQFQKIIHEIKKKL
jgi:hypothetical protein